MNEEDDIVPFISVIILNFNSANETIECIESLIKTNYKNFEIILIDNGSTDNSKGVLEWLENFYPNLNFIRNEENLGFSGGNNIGIRLVKGDYILLLNNDTVVENNFIDKLAEKIRRYPNAAAIGPKIYYYNDLNRIWFAGGKLDWLNGGIHIGMDEIDKGQYDADKEVEYITGCALLMNKKVIEEIGMLDERFFIYYEDVDWCLGARNSGYKCIYVSEPVLWHKVGRTMGEKGRKITERQLYLGTRNKILSMKKNCNNFDYIIFIIKQLLIFTPIYLIFLLIKRERKLLNSYLRGLKDGIE